jgi:hypothetical protein
MTSLEREIAMLLRWAVHFLIFGAGLVVGIAAGGSKACAHDAKPTAAKPQGWSYPLSCCSNFDCKPVPDGYVEERAEGYVLGSGEVVAYNDKRIRNSPDGEFHWCAHQSGVDAGRTICLFVPPRSF